jgi:hypothetical protein
VPLAHPGGLDNLGRTRPTGVPRRRLSNFGREDRLETRILNLGVRGNDRQDCAKNCAQWPFGCVEF